MPVRARAGAPALREPHVLRLLVAADRLVCAPVLLRRRRLRHHQLHSMMHFRAVFSPFSSYSSFSSSSTNQYWCSTSTWHVNFGNASGVSCRTPASTRTCCSPVCSFGCAWRSRSRCSSPRASRRSSGCQTARTPGRPKRAKWSRRRAPARRPRATCTSRAATHVPRRSRRRSRSSRSPGSSSAGAFGYFQSLMIIDY